MPRNDSSQFSALFVQMIVFYLLYTLQFILVHCIFLKAPSRDHRTSSKNVFDPPNTTLIRGTISVVQRERAIRLNTSDEARYASDR